MVRCLDASEAHQACMQWHHLSNAESTAVAGVGDMASQRSRAEAHEACVWRTHPTNAEQEAILGMGEMASIRAAH